MRHRQSGKRLGRNTSHRKAMLRNMVTSLFEHEKITTTDARAKELRPIAEKLITLAKRGDLHARRLATEVVRDRKTVAKLFERIAPRFAGRPGGYTRIIKLGHRLGDNAALSLITLVEEECKPQPKKKAPKPAPAAKAAPAPAAAPVAEPAVASADTVAAAATQESAVEEPKDA
jgi:large subunit ribosomal protein L17